MSTALVLRAVFNFKEEKMSNKYYFTSESVTEGHPDKICDRISDSILDALLEQDKNSRVACETTVTTGLVHIMGEITTTAVVDYAKIARNAINEIGYNNPDFGFDGNSCAVIVSIDEQSPDIAMGVDRSDDASVLGAGDQGMMFGYACDETPELMPMAISYAHMLSARLTQVRKDGTLPYLLPDGKSQVTVRYENGMPSGIDTVIVSTQHTAEVDQEQIHKDIYEHVIVPVMGKENLTDTKIHINPTGRFIIGGPKGDTGLTGRKIIVDTYGGSAAHGGGAFSGKDPTKVDRSAAYMARYAAKNLVAAGVARKCQIQLSYAIGVSQPVSVNIDTYGTSKVSEEKINEIVNNVFDFSPAAIIKHLGLRRPIYAQTASYGHFGRTDIDLPWEKTDKIDEIKKYL